MMPEQIEKRSVSISVNGVSHQRLVDPRLSLADFLREELNFTGTHIGCEHGVCGACTILVEGDAVRACLMLAVQASGKSIATVEGLAEQDNLHPIQIAFRNNHALQCGFCTSGMMMSIISFLEENPDPDEREVREAISGNICRCTGYQGIVAATLEAAAVMRGDGPKSEDV